MAKAKVSEKDVAELAKKGGISPERAREALETIGGPMIARPEMRPEIAKHGGTLADCILAMLISSGEVTRSMLDAKLVLPELLSQAQYKEATQAYKKAMGSKDPAKALQKMKDENPEMWELLGVEAPRGQEGKCEEQSGGGPEKLELAPFGKLEFNRYFWEGEAVLKSWAGFQSRGGGYGSRDAAGASKGRVKLSIKPPGGDDDARAPGKEQIAAFEYLMEHETEIAEAVLRAIFQHYPKLREKYVDFYGEGYMPKIKKSHELKNLIGLGTVHVLNVAREGKAYVGFEFGCEWDVEHGLGVMTHGKRVVAVGDASDSFEEWRATEDGGKGMQ